MQALDHISIRVRLPYFLFPEMHRDDPESFRGTRMLSWTVRISSLFVTDKETRLERSTIGMLGPDRTVGIPPGKRTARSVKKPLHCGILQIRFQRPLA
jgi:hypothetical protein